MRLNKLMTALTLAVGFPLCASAAVLIDPDGPGAQMGISVGSFDWTQTSFLAQGGQAAISAFLSPGGCPAGGCTFNVLTHATLGNFVDAGGNNISGTGLNTNYEWTMIASFTERVTGVIDLGNGTGIATFSTVPAAGGNLEIFYDPTRNSNALTGSGYNDGRLILKGTEIGDATGNFQVTSATPVPIDQSPNGDQYTGQNTVSGTGSNTAIPVGGLDTDPAFFLSTLDSFGISFANVSIGLPYNSTDPSDCFNQAATGTAVGGMSAGTRCVLFHVDGTFAANAGDAGGGYVPNVGAVNGLFGGAMPDFIAQTDYNSPLVAAIPEPASVGLAGLALALLGFGSWRRGRKQT